MAKKKRRIITTNGDGGTPPSSSATKEDLFVPSNGNGGNKQDTAIASPPGPLYLRWYGQLLILGACLLLVAGVFYGWYLPKMHRDAVQKYEEGNLFLEHALTIKSDTVSAYAVHEELSEALWTFTRSRYEFQQIYSLPNYNEQLAKAGRAFELIEEWQGRYQPTLNLIYGAMEEYQLQGQFPDLEERLKTTAQRAEKALNEALAAKAAADPKIFVLVESRDPQTPGKMEIQLQYRDDLNRLYARMERAKSRTEDFVVAVREALSLFDEASSFDLAVEAYLEAGWYDPWWPEARLALADCYAERGWEAPACETYLKAIRLDPGGPAGEKAMQSILAYVRPSESEEKEEITEEAINADLHYFAGLGYLCRGEYPQAAEEFRAVVESDPAFGRFYTAQSVLLFDLAQEADPHKIENHLRETIWIEGTVPPTGVSRLFLPAYQRM